MSTYKQGKDADKEAVERQNLLMHLLSKIPPVDEIKFKQIIYNMKKEFPKIFKDYKFDAHFIYPRDETLDGDIITLKIQGYISEV